MNGMPASSSSRVIVKSYAVSAAIGSLRAFMARMRSGVIFSEFILVKPSSLNVRPVGSLLETCHKFLRRDRGGADFADDDAGGVIGNDGGFDRRRTGRDCQREGRDDGVAGAGNIENFLSHGRDVKMFMAALA